MRRQPPVLSHPDALARADRAAGAGAGEDGAVVEPWWAGHVGVVRVAPPDLDPEPGPGRVCDPQGVAAPLVPPLSSAPSPTPPLAPALPVPGRHASRRVGEGAGEMVGQALGRTASVVVPAPLRGRVRLAPPHLLVVALVLLVAVAVTGWHVVGSRATPAAPAPVVSIEPEGSSTSLAGLDPPLLTTSTSSAPSAPSASSGAALTPVVGDTQGTAASSPAVAPSGESVTVDVAGRVRRPGIAVLPVGARVVDALESAGGARAGVDLIALNLARVLVDGEQIVVGGPAGAPGAVAAPTVPGAAAPAAATGVPTAPVDLNTADQATLETLPEVGPVTAGSILTWRAEHGAFTSVEELLEVDGIGDATLAQIAPHVTL